MAHQKTTAAVSLLEREEGRGVFTRRIEGVSFNVADVRTIPANDTSNPVADFISGERGATVGKKAIFTAPCAAKILGIKFGGEVLPHMGVITYEAPHNGDITFNHDTKKILDADLGLGFLAVGDVVLASNSALNPGPFTIVTPGAAEVVVSEHVTTDACAGVKVTLVACGVCAVDVKKSEIAGTDVSLLLTAKQIQTNRLTNCGYAHTGGTVFVDYTAPANTGNVDDVLICAALGPAANDFFYIGAGYKFDGVLLYVSTLGDFVSTGIWEYYAGSVLGWLPFTPAEDETDGFDGVTALGYYKVRWNSLNLTDWVPDNLPGQLESFHVRFKWVTVTSHGTHPLLQQLWIFPYRWYDWDVEALPGALLKGNGCVVDFDLSSTDGVLALLEGQLVYLEVSTSTYSVINKSDALRVEVEWMPQEV